MRSVAMLGVLAGWACSSPPPAPASSAARPSRAITGADGGVGPAARAVLQPPVAARRPHDVVSPHGTRDDPYYWLRDDARTDAEVLAYLRAENAYADAVMKPLRALEDTLLAEMRGRIQEDDTSVPVLDDGYWYYVRHERGKQHPIHARKKTTLQAPEEVMLDANVEAQGHGYYEAEGLAVTRDGTLLAYAEDTVGRGQYRLRIKNLATGELLPDTAENIAPSLAWGSDGKTLFYTGKDPVTLREDRILRHRIGGPHELAYREEDGAYYVSCDLTKSRKYIVIAIDSTTSSEARLIDAERPTAAPTVFLPRRKDHLYEIDHLGTRFVMRTNDQAQNFRVVEVAPGKATRRSAWRELIAHRTDALVESVALYDSFIAASVRTGGLRKIQIVPVRGKGYFVDAQDPAYAMTLQDTPDPASRVVRYEYDSMVTPTSVFEVDVATQQRMLLKQEPVPTYEPNRYTSEYIHVTASDGSKVPVSLVYRKDTPRDGSAPMMINGYGAYGWSSEPRFDLEAVSLLDRGFVWAIAHVRGGEELGRRWYEDGKLLAKRNTFTDFIAVTEHLVAQRYGARDQVFAIGGSAGGLLLGAVINLRPELYRGILSFVPFVDVVTTMLDESIPLTTNEYDEWGDPRDKVAHDYMLSYSPYDQIRAQGYPAIYVRTGLWDGRVQYFEPAKWVAKLRATRTDDNPIVFEIDMAAGHGGASGRFDKLREYARVFAFTLHVRERPDARGR